MKLPSSEVWSSDFTCQVRLIWHHKANYVLPKKFLVMLASVFAQRKYCWDSLQNYLRPKPHVKKQLQTAPRNMPGEEEPHLPNCPAVTKIVPKKKQILWRMLLQLHLRRFPWEASGVQVSSIGEPVFLYATLTCGIPPGLELGHLPEGGQPQWGCSVCCQALCKQHEATGQVCT